jgi:hypothetical protein
VTLKFYFFKRFYNCVGGVPYDLPCATGLVFDEAQGTCVREEQTSEFAKKCEKSTEKGNLRLFRMSCSNKDSRLLVLL